jgi:DNA-binding response OmpR family regulator
MARFLIVDDEPTVTQTFARALKLDGHEVAVADTAETGLGEATQEPPDAIILDLRMPRMGGLEFLRRLRRHRLASHVPVGIVTGDYFLKEDVLSELAALGASVRYKPLWLDDIAALAAELLNATAHS